MSKAADDQLGSKQARSLTSGTLIEHYCLAFQKSKASRSLKAPLKATKTRARIDLKSW